MSEAEMLDVERTPVDNASISRWRNEGGRMRRVCYNDCDHLSGLTPGGRGTEPAAT
jgi:hypothetical protein